MIRKTPQQVYEELVNTDHILDAEGRITFTLDNVDIIVKQKDVVGNIIQEWLQGWFDAKEISYDVSRNTQMPPDFFLNPDDHTKDLLEVKAFHCKGSPGFDIADFNMYQREIIDKPYMLNVDYLIFSYGMSRDGKVTIKNVWLKKVWEITRRMERWSINLQVKKNVVHKIRPGVFYSQRPRDYYTFRTLEDFISAIEETVYKNPATHDTANQWLDNFLDSYQRYYNIRLVIPRWNDIANSYIVIRENEEQ